MIAVIASILTSAAVTIAAVLWIHRCRQLGITREETFTAFAARAIWNARHDGRRATVTRRDGEGSKSERDAAYRAAIIAVLDRYRTLPIEDPKLLAFMDEITSGCRSGLPLTKLNRWLGYVQGALIERGLATVAEERDLTRPLFRPLDFPEA